MSTNDPMTPERLDTIQERLDSVEFPDNEHLTVMDGEDNHVSWVERSRLDGGVVSGAVVATVHAGSRSAEMFAHAPQDITDLLAEVERLRALTTVDDAMVKRGAFALARRRAEDPLARDRVVGHTLLVDTKAVLDAALGTGEGA